MLTHLRPALVLTVLFSVLTGILYPLAITGIGAVIAPGAASGSLVTRDGVVVGSSLVGQGFSEDRYFHGRGSAAGDGYDGASSSGTNLGPTSAKLLEAVTEAVGANGGAGAPADAVTSSGSGLDPDISPENARRQAGRVATARNRPVAEIKALVERNVQGRALGLVGEPRVNVLALNIALDAAAPMPR